MPEETLITRWGTRKTTAESVQTPLFQKFKEYYDQFFSVTKNMQSPWRSRLYLPEYFYIIWTKAAVITGKNINFQVNGRTPEDNANSNYMKKVLDYQIREPHVDPSHYARFTTGTIDSLVTGTGIYKVNFNMQRDSFKQHVIDDDGMLDTKNTEVIRRMARWNDFEPIMYTRFFIDPAATSLQSAAWIIHEDFLTKEAIKSKNATTPGYYKNIAELDELGGATDTLGQYTSSRNNLVKIADKLAEDETIKYIRVWNCYEKKFDTKTGEPYINHLVIAGGRVIIKDEHRLPYWHNKYPFAVQYDYNRPGEFWGIGEIEATQSIVKGMNDNMNHFMDNINLSNNTMIMRESSTVLEPFIIEPGGEVIFDGTKPEQFRFPDPNGSSFQIVQTYLLQSLERSTGVSGYFAGTPSSSIDKTRGTKGGIEQITQNAFTRIAYTQRQVADFFEQVGRQWLSNIQQFFTEDFFVRLTNGNFERLSPADIRGEFDLYVSDTTLSPSSNVERMEMINQMFDRLESLRPALQSEGKTIQISPLVSEYLGLLGQEKPENILVQAPEAPQGADVKKNIVITFAGKDLPEQIQAEILAEQFDSGNMPQEQEQDIELPMQGLEGDMMLPEIGGMSPDGFGDIMPTDEQQGL